MKDHREAIATGDVIELCRPCQPRLEGMLLLVADVAAVDFTALLTVPGSVSSNGQPVRNAFRFRKNQTGWRLVAKRM